jgi:hypothetical protein
MICGLHLHLTAACDFYRIPFPRELRLMTTFIKSSCSCRCLCWDHALSLAFDNLTLRSWTTPTKELQWLQLISTSTHTSQLMVMYSSENPPTLVGYPAWNENADCTSSSVVVYLCSEEYLKDNISVSSIHNQKVNLLNMYVGWRWRTIIALPELYCLPSPSTHN